MNKGPDRTLEEMAKIYVRPKSANAAREVVELLSKLVYIREKLGLSPIRNDWKSRKYSYEDQIKIIEYYNSKKGRGVHEEDDKERDEDKNKLPKYLPIEKLEFDAVLKDKA